MDAGAQGYLVKENAVSDVLAGLKAVAAGEYSSALGRAILVRRHHRASALKEQKKDWARSLPPNAHPAPGR